MRHVSVNVSFTMELPIELSKTVDLSLKEIDRVHIKDHLSIIITDRLRHVKFINSQIHEINL